MKRKTDCPKPTPECDIRRTYKKFISELPKRYRRVERGYNSSLYALVADCASLAKVASGHAHIEEELRNGSYWRARKPTCPEGEYVKLAVRHTLQPNLRGEQSKASKWIAVIKSLWNEEGPAISIVDALKKGGGIETLYAKATGRRVGGDDLTSDREDAIGEDESEDGSNAEPSREMPPSRSPDLEVILKGTTITEVLRLKSFQMELKVGGRPVPGRSNCHRRVEGRILKAFK